MIIPYIPGLLALLVYAWHESKKEKVKIWAWIVDHKTVMIIAAVAMVAATYFSAVILPVLMVPIVMALASAWLSGSLLNAVIKWVTAAWQYLFGSGYDNGKEDRTSTR